MPSISVAGNGLAVIVTCEHARPAIPAAYRKFFARSKARLKSHRGYDAGALVVATTLSRRLKTTLLAGTMSRLLIDLNRSLHHPRLFGPELEGASATTKAIIVDRYWRPHRRVVEAAIGRSVRRGRPVLHIAVHSFTPVWEGKRRRCDIGVLYDPRRSSEKAHALRLAGLLRAKAQLLVRRNYPYRGQSDGLTTHLRRLYPGKLYSGIEIELNQALLADRRDQGRMGHMIADVLSAYVLQQRCRSRP